MLKMMDKTLNSLAFKMFALYFFCCANLFIITFLFLYSGNFFLEIYKWLQFIAIIFLLFYLFRKRFLAFLIICFFYFLYAVLAVYFIITHTSLDFSFLKRNFININDILPQYIFHFSVIFAIALINSFLIYKFQPRFKFRSKYLLIFLTLFIFIPQIIQPNQYNNELIAFAKTIYNKDQVIDCYQSYYNQLIQNSINGKELILSDVQANPGQLPEYLDNIIILQLEGLNGYLVNKKNTPNFMAIAQQGVFFPKFYANSVQTILGQENILCSLPSSFDMNLVTSGNDQQVLCLTEILKKLSYKTFFLKSYQLKFANTGKFMRNLQFDEVHADDIMGQGDIKYPWGYREDVFYQKALNYFKNNKNEKYNFLYLGTGPTNHWPFNTPKEMQDIVPFKEPKKFQEKLINTTYLQDKHLKIAWDYINNIFPEKNYTLFILADHGWPAEFHKNNTFNEKGAYEENFITSMIMVIGNEKKYKNKIITTRYSQMDIMSSILGLFNIDHPANKFSSSFVKEIKGQALRSPITLLIQPYSSKYINFIDNNLKYQYNSNKRHIMLSDLANDPDEKNSQIISSNKAKNLEIIEELLN